MNIERKRFKVLNIDGGGIKGLIPLFFCDLLEKMTGEKIYDLFDFFSGTSIGGIISIFFSQRIYTAGELLVKMLGQLKNKIFPSKRYFDFILFKNSLYNPQIIEDVLQELIGQTLFKNAKGNFLITGSEMEGSVCEPSIFVSFDDKKEYLKINTDVKKQDFFQFTSTEKIPDDLKLWQIARITSAAYPFFSKYTAIPNLEFLDGGYTYNNPSYLALKYLEEVVRMPLENVFMVSLGCNEDTHRQSVNVNFLNKNILNLGSELMSNLPGLYDNMNNSSYHTLLLVDAYLKKNHVRISPINMEEISLDNVDNDSINKLKNTAREMIKQYQGFTPFICSHLGIKDINHIRQFNKESKFYVIPRYHRYKEYYKDLDELIKTELDSEELIRILDYFDFPEDVKVNQKITKIFKEKSSFFKCCSHSTFSVASFALATGHLGFVKQNKKEITDIFEYVENNQWTIFHTVAVNCELAGLAILIEDEFLEPNTLNKYGESFFNVQLRQNLEKEKIFKLYNAFLSHKGIIYNEQEAERTNTPLGLAYKYKSVDVIDFFKRCKKALTKIKGNNEVNAVVIKVRNPNP